MPLRVLLLLIPPPENWNYVKLLSTLALAEGCWLSHPTDVTNPRGTQGDLDVSSYWMMPGTRYIDSYLMLSVMESQVYAKEN